METSTFRQRMKSAVAIAALMVCGHQAQAADIIKVDNICYQITGDTTCRVMPDNPQGSSSSNSYSGIVKVPMKVKIGEKEYTVTAFGPKAFAYSNVTGVSIPKTVVHFDSMAFASTYRLKSFTIPQNIRTIAAQCFSFSSIQSMKIFNGLDSVGDGGLGYMNQLTDSLVLPASVRAMAPGALGYSQKLEKIVVDPENPYWKSIDGVVYSKDGKTLFACPTNKYAEVFEIPRGVKYIEEKSCASLNRVKTVSFPMGGSCIVRPYAFYSSTSIENVERLSSVVEFQEGAFAGCTKIKKLSFGNSTKRIEKEAFSSVGRFVDSPEDFVIDLKPTFTLRYIGANAFSGCPMKNVYLQQYVDTIDQSAFSSCQLLESVDINPANMTYASINGCIYDRQITKLIFVPAGFKSSIFDFPEGVHTVGEKAFAYCTNVRLINFPESIRTWEQYAFAASGLLKCDIPASIKVIPAECFAATPLGEIVIPETVKEMKEGIFDLCKQLTKVSLPNSLDSVSSGTFYGCESLKDVNIPTSAKRIGYKAFGNCYALEEIEIPDSVELIEEMAFWCRSTPYVSGTLSKITFGKNLRTIQKEAFAEQKLIREITSFNPEPPVCPPAGVFAQLVHDKAVVSVPEGSLDAYKNAEIWSLFSNRKTFKTHDAVEAIEKDDESIVRTADGAIECEADSLIEIYTLGGSRVYSGYGGRIELPAKGIYIVRINGKSIKLAV